MKNRERLIYGIFITIAIYLLSIVLGKYCNPNINLISKTGTHIVMMILSVIAIVVFRRKINYMISFPKFKKSIMPIILGILSSFFVMVIMVTISKITGLKLTGIPMVSKMPPMQIFLSVFIFASFVEELLFRGFLLNFITNFSNYKVSIFNIPISISVIISAVMFGAAHLILFKTGASTLFVINVLLFTTTLGIIAGYYQEKYDNNAYAIIVHMSGNLLAVLGAILRSLN